MNMIKPLNTILIGYGRMGKNHFRVLSKHPYFNVTAIIDPLIHADAFSGTNVFVYQKLEDFFSANSEMSWDCAVVAAPTELHASILEVLIEKNKPVLLEKPLAIQPEECRSLVDKAKQFNARVAIGHLERFNPVVRKLKDLLQSKLIGEPIHFSCTRIGGYPNNVKDENNVLLDLATHDIDTLNFLVGRMHVQSSVCHAAYNGKIFDTAEVLLNNFSGISASIHVNWITPTKLRTLRVTGTQGVCFIDYILQTIHIICNNLLKKQNKADFTFSSLIEDYKSTDKIEFGVQIEEPLKLQLDEFYRFTSGLQTTLCTLDDAQYAVEIATDALAYAKTYAMTSQLKALNKYDANANTFNCNY